MIRTAGPRQHARRPTGRTAALAALLAMAACGRPAPQPEALPQRPALRATPPAGEYALTDSISIVIERAPGLTAGPAHAWTLRIGADSAREVVPIAGGWRVPSLGIDLEAAERDGVPGIQVHRYGETVFAGRRADARAASAATRPLPDALADLTPRLMIALDVPGVGIALIRDGDIVWRGYFGVKRSGSEDRIDSLTIFEAASMSKPAYAYPFMKLVENGSIPLDSPLVDYLGRDYIAGDTLHRAITARMVLSHTSGFPNWRGDDGLTVEFEPGTQVGYSGEGFQFLQRVAEEVTGEPMAEFTRDRLFAPLGLASASYVWLPEYDSTYATGHTADGEPRPRRPYIAANAAYTLYITPAGYARILIEIMRADRSAPHSLSPATRSTMLASQHVAPDREPIRRGGRADGEVHYALGWRFDRTASGDRYWHSGSNSTGFQCYAEFDPATGDGIVIMTNSSSGSPLWRALIDATGRP